MGGKMPFITRYGITLVVVALIAVVSMLYVSGGSPHQLMKEMIENTLEQIRVKSCNCRTINDVNINIPYNRVRGEYGKGLATLLKFHYH